MNATVKDVMTNQVVAVRRGATFKEMAACLVGVLSRTDVLAVRDRLS
jgi:hypothetical protein